MEGTLLKPKEEPKEEGEFSPSADFPSSPVFDLNSSPSVEGALGESLALTLARLLTELRGPHAPCVGGFTGRRCQLRS